MESADGVRRNASKKLTLLVEAELHFKTYFSCPQYVIPSVKSVFFVGVGGLNSIIELCTEQCTVYKCHPFLLKHCFVLDLFIFFFLCIYICFYLFKKNFVFMFGCQSFLICPLHRSLDKLLFFLWQLSCKISNQSSGEKNVDFPNCLHNVVQDVDEMFLFRN